VGLGSTLAAGWRSLTTDTTNLEPPLLLLLVTLESSVSEAVV
jgi:hypothetical protein